MDNGIVPNYHMLSNAGRVPKATVEDTTVLDIAAVTHNNGIYIPPERAVIPEGDILSERDIAQNGGILRAPHAGREFGGFP